jgi:chromate transport protein ChrA
VVAVAVVAQAVWGMARTLAPDRERASIAFLAALYHPVWTSAIHAPGDFALGLVDFGLLVLWKWPPWLVVVLSALGGAALARL